MSELLVEMYDEINLRIKEERSKVNPRHDTIMTYRYAQEMIAEKMSEIHSRVSLIVEKADVDTNRITPREACIVYDNCIHFDQWDTENLVIDIKEISDGRPDDYTLAFFDGYGKPKGGS